MNHAPPSSSLLSGLRLLARLVLGGLYIYMGLIKALAPVAFLKILREYNITSDPFILNAIAITLPWFEIFCGVLLVLGIALRATALLSLLMLVPFTLLVLDRALALHAAGNIPFCGIRFDCGCGAGEVLICAKLAENAVLSLLSAWLVFDPRPSRGCLRPDLFPGSARPVST